MKEELYMPIWIKTILAFVLVMAGILFTFIVFRFFPVSKDVGFDHLGSLMYVFIALGGCFLLFVVGLLFDKRHPYTLFVICLFLFTILLIIIRSTLF